MADTMRELFKRRVAEADAGTLRCPGCGTLRTRREPSDKVYWFYCDDCRDEHEAPGPAHGAARIERLGVAQKRDHR